MDPIYVTTPIYYVTDAPHIGHLYTTAAADVLCRYYRLSRRDVHFLTGTDEHGQKMQKRAKELGEEPQALADRVVQRYLAAWKRYEITYDDFIRTTEERHKKVVTAYLEQLLKSGDIYLAEYEGWYCVPDESYWTESQVVDGKCPECGRAVEKLKEESYFFRMSRYEQRLLKHIEDNPDFIFPPSRKNEVIGFIKQGLKDISASRTTISWGIPMPTDGKAKQKHTVYVWFDALTNYLSALQPLENTPEYKKYWGHAIHYVGKDILRFHAVYWPTFLMALGLPLPKQIVAHGWLTDSNRKIGKSLGNAIDPMVLADEVGVDAFRYFLFREFVFGLDGEYTRTTMINRINSDLANDYGNAVSRVSSMILKYFGGTLPSTGAVLAESSELKTAVEVGTKEYHELLPAYAYHRALESLWKVLSVLNRTVESTAPWTLAKSDKPEDKKTLERLLVHSHETLRIISILLQPVLPSSSLKALETLGRPSTGEPFTQATWGAGGTSIAVAKPTPLFPRLEVKTE